MKPIEIACPICARQPGEMCIEFSFSHASLVDFHAKRIADAAAINDQPGNAPTIEQFNKAVEDSDLL